MADLRLALRITAENGQLKAELRNSEQLVKNFGATTQRAGTQAASGFFDLDDGVKTVGRSLMNLRRLVLESFAVVAVAQFTRSFVDAQVELQRFEFTLQSIYGDQQKVNEEMTFLRQVSDRLGLSLAQTASGYVRMAASAHGAGVSTQALHQGFIGLADAATVLHLSGQDLNGILVQLDQGMSLGRVQMQDLRAIAQHMPGVFDLVNQAFANVGLSAQQMLQQGGLPAKQFFELFTALLRDKYAPTAQAASHSLNAAINSVSTAWFEFRNQVLSGDAESGVATALSTLAKGLQVVGQDLGQLIPIAEAALGLGLLSKLQSAVVANARLREATAATAAERVHAAKATAELARAKQVDAAASLEVVPAARADALAALALARAKNAQAQAQMAASRAAGAQPAALRLVAEAEAQAAVAAREYSAALTEVATLGRQQAALSAELVSARHAEAAATVEAAAAQKELALARGGVLGALAGLRASMGRTIQTMGRVRGAAVIMARGLSAGANLAFAAWAGWEIGTTLFKKFGIVRKAAGKTIEMLLIGAAKVKQYWQQAGVTMTDVFTGAFSRIGDDVAAIGAKTDAEIARIKANFGPGFWKHDGPDDGGLPGASKPQTPQQKHATASLADAQKRASQLKNAEKLLQDSLDRRKRELKAALDANRVSYADYYARLANMQRKAIQSQIRTVRAQMAVVAAQTKQAKANPQSGGSGSDAAAKAVQKRAQLTTQLTILRRQLGDVSVTETRKTAEAQQKLNDQLDKAKQKLLTLTDPLKAAREKVAAQFTDLIDTLKTAARTSDVQIVVGLQTRLQNKAAGDVIRKQAQDIVNRVRRRVQSLSQQVQIGTITTGQAQVAQQKAQGEAAQSLDELIAKSDELHGALGEKVARDLQGMRRELQGLRAPINQLTTDITGGLLQSTQQWFSTIIQGTQSAQSAFASFLASVSKMLADIAAKMLARKVISGALGLAGMQIAPNGQVMRRQQQPASGAAAMAKTLLPAAAGLLKLGANGATTAANGAAGAQTSLLTKIGDGLKTLLTGGKSILGKIGGALSGLFEGSGASDLLKTIGSGFKSLFTGSGASSLISTIGGALKSLFSALGGGSGGGSGWGAAISGIASVASSFFVDGGHVSGPGTTTSDSIPAMLSNGEYVMNARAVQRIGVGMLDALNGGNLPRARHYATGGLVGGAASMSRMSGNSHTTTISVPVSIATSSDDDDPQTAQRRGQQLGQALRAAVQQELVRQKRPGGLLHQSTVTSFG